ncbi:FAD-dependent oxidoreductase (plasmid) [Haloferax sp. S1W]|uniref:FAD-dependent oxidoreductase n=1 Tax=Haloferax sp. S1W TaxID=3377110 RepID=UPI0037CA0784
MTLATIDRYDPDCVSTVGERAVVVGGSLAGLCMARVLADGFREVVVLERDPLPDEPVDRDGAPQTSHPHVLLEAGRATLEDLFPGFCDTVLAEGGLRVNTSVDMYEYNGGGYLAHPQQRLITYCASRPLFESIVRQQARSIDTISLRDNHQFLDYLTTDDGGTVTGVQFRDGSSGKSTLSADLVVDATGRTSRTPTWLSDHGYDAPPVDEVTIDVTYSTVRIERPPDDRQIILVPPDAPRTRGGALVPIEDGRWEVILQGIHDDSPPAEADALIEFADRLPVSDIADQLRSQRWVSEEIQQYPYPTSRRHRYELLDAFPDRLVVTGDAIASFNPIYGQGMSAAALDAVLFHHTLASGGLDNLAPRFFDRVSDLVDNIWRMAVGSDFEFAQTTGSKPRGTSLANWYMTRLVKRAHSDPVLSEAFARVARLEVPATTLLRPPLVWRTLRPFGDSGSSRSVIDRMVDAVPVDDR